MTVFSRIIEQYGSEAVLYLEGGESAEAKCFIEPVMTRNAEGKTWREETYLGERDMRRYYGYFPESAELSKAEYFFCGGVYYDIVRAERFSALSTVSHWEAVLSLREEPADE